jgi:multiple antibiotic resistance protein
MTEFLGLLKDFSLVFLPLFVAMDPVSVLPFLFTFLGPLNPRQRRKVIYTALTTGLVIGFVFLALGKAIFFVLGIRVSDFLVAGGIVLLALSLRELLSSSSESPSAPDELLAVVPIGTPLLVGPATISMLILLSGLFALWLVVLAFLTNMLLAWIIFGQFQRIIDFLGKGGLQAFAKVSYLLLAAIAVQLITRGITDIWKGIGAG